MRWLRSTGCGCGGGELLRPEWMRMGPTLRRGTRGSSLWGWASFRTTRSEPRCSFPRESTPAPPPRARSSLRASCRSRSTRGGLPARGTTSTARSRSTGSTRTGHSVLPGSQPTKTGRSSTTAGEQTSTPQPSPWPASGPLSRTRAAGPAQTCFRQTLSQKRPGWRRRPQSTRPTEEGPETSSSRE